LIDPLIEVNHTHLIFRVEPNNNLYIYIYGCPDYINSFEKSTKHPNNPKFSRKISEKTLALESFTQITKSFFTIQKIVNAWALDLPLEPGLRQMLTGLRLLCFICGHHGG
jgi:hypothetical protein